MNMNIDIKIYTRPIAISCVLRVITDSTTNRLTNPSTNQPTDQLIDQPTNQPTDL